MASTLSRDEIEAYYADVPLPRLSFGQWEDPYGIYDMPKTMPVSLEFDRAVSSAGKTYFRVVLLDVGLDTNIDPRCH